ncbi:MAG: substrate-binding domain-containing protein [Chloroflexota bacterium]|nr:substrate-binding domain-containing protein [Chloroflexota bacterium]
MEVGIVKRTLAIVASSAVLVAACSGTPSTGGDKVKVAFIAGQIGITFYTGVECGAKAAAKEFNVDLNWTGSHNWDINETRPLIDAAKATSPQGWVISPTDPDALVNDIKGFMAAKQWVVTIDAPMSQPVDLQNIQSNHYDGGKTAAEAMAKLTQAKGKYLVLHMQPGLPDIGGRADGFRDAMTTAGGTVLEYVYPGTDQAKAADAVSAAITANPDLAGVYATHETAANGAASAIKAGGKTGAIKLVAFDSAPNQIADLKNGVYDALIAQAPFNMGYQSVKMVADAIRGKVDTATVTHDNPTGLYAITVDNVDSAATKPWIYPADLNTCPTKPL